MVGIEIGWLIESFAWHLSSPTHNNRLAQHPHRCRHWPKLSVYHWPVASIRHSRLEKEEEWSLIGSVYSPDTLAFITHLVFWSHIQIYCSVYIHQLRLDVETLKSMSFAWSVWSPLRPWWHAVTSSNCEAKLLEWDLRWPERVLTSNWAVPTKPLDWEAAAMNHRACSQ